MANNRLYLKCICCGETYFLGKSFLDGYFTDGFVDQKDLNKFFDDHEYCHNGDKGPWTDGDFRLEYEDPIQCIVCKGPIDPDDKYCRHCGREITEDG